jgi:hypothetical protein
MPIIQVSQEEEKGGLHFSYQPGESLARENLSQKENK